MARRPLIAVGLVVSVLFGATVTWLKAVPRAARGVGDPVVEDPEDDEEAGDDEPDRARPVGKRKARGKARRPRGKADGAVAPPIAPSAPASDRPDAPEEAPNVVLVFGCTVRRDQIGVYGGVDGVTPWLDGLAAEGVRMDDALSVSSWTRASAVGVITGRHPLSFNLPDPGPKQSERVLSGRATTLAERLSGAGWMAYGVTANPNLNANYGMAQGMDLYQDSDDQAFKKGRMSGLDVVRRSLEMLDARAEEDLDRPFYLRLMMIDAHHPRTPDPALVRKFTAPMVSPTMAEYRASLHELDQALARLDAELRERGYDETNTVFVFVSDHGEGLNEPPHHGPGHGKQMFPSTVAIPWILRGPGIPANVVVGGMSSGVDVKPTLLGLLGLPGESGLAGRDLAPWIRGHRQGNTPRQRGHSLSMFHVANVAAIWTPDRQCQRWYPGDRDETVSGCFDRHADPTFATPLPDDSGLLEELDAWRNRQLEIGKSYPAEVALVGDDQKSQLEVLGYVSDD
ncbi:MAG: sulfatase-like hydrolase/transferase [Myxococcota bacterium]